MRSFITRASKKQALGLLSLGVILLEVHKLARV